MLFIISDLKITLILIPMLLSADNYYKLFVNHIDTIVRQVLLCF